MVRHTVFACVAAAIASLCLGCASSVAQTSEEPGVFHATGVAFLEPRSETAGPSDVEWDMMVEAVGHGLPAAGATTPAQKAWTALEAAKQSAMAALVEKLKGAHVRAEARVKNLMFAGQEITVETAGDLEGARTTRSRYDEAAGVAEVEMTVALDAAGNVLPERLASTAPPSLRARRARAEVAATADAMAKLREQVGEVWIEQEVMVKDLLFRRQRAQQVVQGMVEGAEFARPVWDGARCTVEARLRLKPEDLERLQAAARPAQ